MAGRGETIAITSTSAELDPWLEVGIDTPLGFAVILSNDDHEGLDSRLELDPADFDGSDAADWWSKLRVRVSAPAGSIGEVEMVPDELEGANLTQDAARVAYTSQTHGRWLLYALRSTRVFAQLQAGALGATITGINIRDLKRALLPVPSNDDQCEIAQALDAEIAKIDKLTRKIEDGIARLREFRTALISAAVTGSIDVREEVA